MKFGRNATEAASESSRSGGGGQFMRYLKDGDQTMRILQEPDEWTYYWEHFSPAGFSFPCPRSVDDPIEDCPGCSSDNDKMRKVQRRIAFNILHSFNGMEYVDVMKIGSTVADKLENRYKRFGTVTDRDYTITRYKTKSDRYDFEVEGSTPTPVNLRKEDWKDPEELLKLAWDEAFGEVHRQPPPGPSGGTATTANGSRATEPAKRVAIEPTPSAQEEPPFEERSYQESDLRAMEFDQIVALVKSDLGMDPPGGLQHTAEVVDWLMAISS